MNNLPELPIDIVHKVDTADNCDEVTEIPTKGQINFSKPFYYFLSWTWGIIMSLIGAIGTLYFISRGYKVQRHGGCFWVETGENWGGINLGMFFFYQKCADEQGKNHEYGHSLQNCVYGPFFPFLITIPSAIRYHYRKNQIKKGIKPKGAYDDIWFEG